MLVLTRKVGESVMISRSIRVTVMKSANGRIRLGIVAPPEVRILREELIAPRSPASPTRHGAAEAQPLSALSSGE